MSQSHLVIAFPFKAAAAARAPTQELPELMPETRTRVARIRYLGPEIVYALIHWRGP
jgi:hypothetical protein